MNWLTRYLLNRICKQLVEQGPEHQYRITEYYKIMWNAANTEFTEDNNRSLKAFLKECHSNASISRQSIELESDYEESIELESDYEAGFVNGYESATKYYKNKLRF